MKRNPAARLLIVDDEPIIGKRLQQVFGKSGIETVIFTNPVRAMEAMAEERFSIVITDYRMEEMNGLAVLGRVMQLNPKAKVIMITGYPSQELEAAAVQGGVFEFMAKPFRMDELKEAVSRAMEELREENGQTTAV
ncbi:Response regulatory domain-containing protein [Candidatus Electronema halotolerans]|jgi:DNA-binding NtrC family response regulator